MRAQQGLSGMALLQKKVQLKLERGFSGHQSLFCSTEPQMMFELSDGFYAN